MCKKGWTQRVFIRRASTESQWLEPTAQAATWAEYEWGIEPPLFEIFVPENAFQAI